MTTEATLYIAGDLVTNLGKSLSLRTTIPELNISSLPKLNDKTFGLPKKKLTIIAARPSHGKTSFMSQIAKDLAMAGKKTLILSYEESKEQLMERLFCNMAKVPNRDIQRGLFYKYADMYEDWAKHMKKIPLALTDCVDKDCRALAEVLDSMPVDLRPDVIFVDYIQAIKGLGSLQQGNERSMLDEYIKHFRKMAAHYNFAGVLMSQINRSTELVRSKDQGPKIHQLKGTGFLEEHADLVLLIHWLYKTTGKQSDYHQVWIDVAKNKSGETGKVLLDFDPSTYSYRDAVKPSLVEEEDEKPRRVVTQGSKEEITDEEAIRLKELFGGDFVEPEIKQRGK